MIGRQFPRADALSMVATPENSEEPLYLFVGTIGPRDCC